MSSSKAVRDLPAIRKLLDELEEEGERFVVDDEVVDELRGALEVRPLLPKVLNHHRRKNVRAVQEALMMMEARLDRCLYVQDEVRTKLRFFTRIEYEVKQALFRSGFITEKSSKPSTDQAIALAVPEFVSIKDDWKGLEELCRSLHKRLSEAKETVKLMSRLDDNYRWSNAN
jgi:hypothetical protein